MKLAIVVMKAIGPHDPPGRGVVGLIPSSSAAAVRF